MKYQTKRNLMSKVVKTACQACHCECGVLVHLDDDGKITKIVGDPDHPMNEGMICPKGANYQQLVYHPDRLKYPLKRAGERGGGKWQKISWDEALDTISKKFKEIIEKYGPETIEYVHMDAPRTYHAAYALLLFAMGSPGIIGPSHTCYHPTMIADKITVGSFVSHEVGPDFDNAKVFFIAGANPIHTHPPLARKILRAQREKGAKLIVVDPRKTEFAEKADLWLQVKPGTDCALNMGIIRHIIDEELYDKEFVDKWCVGFEKLKKRAQEYPLEKVEKITWVPREQIRQAAEMYATIKPGCHYHRVAVEQIGKNSFQTVRTYDILMGITGNLEKKGTNFKRCHPPGYKWDFDLWREGMQLLSREEKMKQVGAKDYPLLAGPDSQTDEMMSPVELSIKSILSDDPHRPRAIFGVANFLTSSPNSEQALEALKKLEFTVFADFFMTPTLEYVDVVLPAATWLEVDDVCDMSYTNYICARRKAIEPLYECKDEKWIVIELIKRMGLKDRFVTSAETVEDFLNYKLRGMGIDFNELKRRELIVEPLKYNRHEKEGFNTPSGKVELYSSILEKHGYDPLPYYEEFEEPSYEKDFPLILIAGRRHVAYFHSANRQVPALRKLNPDPTIEINPKVAQELGIADGDWVWIQTPYAAEKKIKQKAKVTDRVHPKTVCAEPFWWFPEEPGPDHGVWKSNINYLMTNDPPYDPVTATPLLRTGRCRIFKAE